MSKNRILRAHSNIVLYDDKHWDLLCQKRDRALIILEMFQREGLNAYVYGSIARGDVHDQSDIDIIYTQIVPTYRIEYILQKNDIETYSREIIMATPNDAVKLYYNLSELESITVPLTKFEKNSIDFYDFGGKLDFNQLKSGFRVGGVDKRLVYIKPIHNGHQELSIINNESQIAKELNISVEIINERRNVLLKREKKGRTGVFLKRIVGKDESPEEVLRQVSNRNSIVRKKVLQP